MIFDNSKQFLEICFFVIVSIWLWFEALFGHWSNLKKTCWDLSLTFWPFLALPLWPGEISAPWRHVCAWERHVRGGETCLWGRDMCLGERHVCLGETCVWERKLENWKMKKWKIEKWRNWKISKFQNLPTKYFIRKNYGWEKWKAGKWKIPKKENVKKNKKLKSWKNGKTIKSLIPKSHIHNS